MPECELLSTCLFLNDNLQELPELKKKVEKQYCHGEYGWCGRYMIYKAQEREMSKVTFSDISMKITDVISTAKRRKI
jgi:hypothetical protein